MLSLAKENIDLTQLKTGGLAKPVDLCLLINNLESTKASRQPAEIQLPGIKDEFIILPTTNGDFFFGLKNKIIRLSRIELDLRERVKELECLYSISKESDASNNLEEFLQRCTKIIVAGFQYPEETKVNIEISGRIYGNENGRPLEVTDLLAANILLDGKEIGKLNVYRRNGPEFLIEEKNLINEIASKISHIIEKDEKARNLKKQQKILKSKNEALVRMTEECCQKREELSTFFKAMSDKIVVIDSDFNIIMSNKDDIGNTGKCYNKLFNLDYPCEECSAVKAFNTKNNSMLALEFKDRHYTLRAHPIMRSEGKVDRVLEVCRDATERKRMETQLLQSYKLASLGKLVAGVAHEINNPNTFILGNLKILQESLTDIFPILDESIPKFRGNINKLEQVFINLVMNASEAIVNNEGVIKIKTGFNRQKDEVYLIVSDNGCGMSEATLKNIFDPFFTTKRDSGGIGLAFRLRMES